MVKEITSEAEFKSTIQNNAVVVVDFYATWCGPCRAIAPGIETLEKDLGDKVTFCKVDVDQQTAIAKDNEVTAMPTFRVFYKGELKDTIVGANLPKITTLATELGNKAAAEKAAASAATA